MRREKKLNPHYTLTATLSTVGNGELVVALPADPSFELADVAVGTTVGPADRTLGLGLDLPTLGPTDALWHTASQYALPSLRAADPEATRATRVALDAAAQDLPEEEGSVVVVLLAVGRRLRGVGAPAALLFAHTLRQDFLAAARAVHVRPACAPCNNTQHRDQLLKPSSSSLFLFLFHFINMIVSPPSARAPALSKYFIFSSSSSSPPPPPSSSSSSFS